MNAASATAKELQVLSGFAVDDSTAFALAVQPDDRYAPNYRTHVLRVRPEGAELAHTIGRPLQSCWLSRQRVAYCTTLDGEVVSFHQGVSSSERVCGRDEPLDAIVGFDGATADDDTLVVTGEVSIFVRRGGRWQEFQLADEVGEIYRLHGLSVDELYVCTDEGIYFFDGAAFSPRDGPDDDEILDIFVRAEGDIVAVGEGIHVWSGSGGWRRLKSPFRQHSAGVCSIGGSLFVPSRHGVLRLTGATIEKISTAPAGQLIALGERVLAAGRDAGLACYDGQRWVPLPLPRMMPHRGV